MTEHSKLTIRCPDCDSHLVVDRLTGEVLFHQPTTGATPKEADFDSLLANLDDEKLHAEEIFKREVAAHEDRDRLLEDKFKEALSRADGLDDGKPPPSPFDAD